MSLKIGIIGLPNVGKSTLFQALTKKQVDTSNYPFATIDPNVGVVGVPDKRLEKLWMLSNSNLPADKARKMVPAIVEFVDIAGLVKGAASGEGLGNKFLTHIRGADAICHIVRAFENENIVHIAGKPNPFSDIETIKTELALKDLETLAKIKEKAQKEAKAGKKETVELLQNLESLEKMLQEPLQSPPLTKGGDDSLLNVARNYQLLSFKPTLYVFNISSKNNVDISQLPSPTTHHSITIDISQENDISNMSDEEKKELDLESQLPKLIKAAYELLELMTFFTTGEDETRAWTIPKNSTAKQAGRAIHSDFEEKFIRADIIFWEKLLEAGGWTRARELGWLRSEGKEYIVQDGDVVEFKI